MIVMVPATESLQTAAESLEDAMRVVSLLLGIVLGFIIAAGFYGGGGAITIAGKQIGPDILLQGDVHSEGSGRTVEPGAAIGIPPVGSADEPVEVGNPNYNSPKIESQNKEKPLSGENSYFKVRWPK
jgi:hypothetical protein